MNKYQILLEYVGTKYVGWQSQKNGRSIQNTVQLYLSKLLKKKITIYGAGRTDSGVHAIEQSAHFYYKEKLTNIPKLIIPVVKATIPVNILNFRLYLFSKNWARVKHLVDRKR